ncbi:carbamoyltransferase N-terminal domain-containing protein [Streptomyces sp. NPDC050287]|uniref:carbamoyltransferase N-terminal domain-containing protein n=1 Tax=Streptomyces sp. NPDC050287 TaxID=3365608 RepID=UPI0037B95728
MLICGLKLTHDGAVALIDGNRLITSVETEKLDNGYRYSELGDLTVVESVLKDVGVGTDDVDAFVVDGWGHGEERPQVTTRYRSKEILLAVAPYREERLEDDTTLPRVFQGLPWKKTSYRSYNHATGHVFSAYCASPFAASGQPALVLVWDGGVLPRCYRIRAGQQPVVENLGPIFGLIGNVYPTFAMHFPPFRPEDLGDDGRSAYRQLTVPGKVMAYTALGEVRSDLCDVMDDIYDQHLTLSLEFAGMFSEEFLRRTAEREVEPADAMASFQHWVGGRLVQGLALLRQRCPDLPMNLVLSGGCALNIKWNSRIRAGGLFEKVWVPPFPNDSGSALGVACAEMSRLTGTPTLDWSVYSGPEMIVGEDVDGWTNGPLDVFGLARLLHETGEPVLILHGRAELGPRALGNRSILAAPNRPEMKDLLNKLKGREYYRPVSPICLEHRAPEVFDPGVPDPYMLFEHQVRDTWQSRVPAVMHLDGSARLQTVNHHQNPVVAEVLEEYARLSGIPVLCNTSANNSGRGFFPDVASALRWGRTRYVWNGGRLWTRTGDGQRAMAERTVDQ